MAEETPQQRRERYLANAREAKQLAERSRVPDIRASFEAIARVWERLADDAWKE